MGSGVRRLGAEERLRVRLLSSLGLSLLPLPCTGLGESRYRLLTRLSGLGDLGLADLALCEERRGGGDGDLPDDILEYDETDEIDGERRKLGAGDIEELY